MNDTPAIFLHLNGQQAGPYQPAQIRQLWGEGKVSAETPAWHKELPGWSTLGTVMAAFPDTTPATPLPPVPPSTLPPLPSTTATRAPLPLVPAKKKMSGCLLAAIIVGVIGVFGFGLIAILAGIALGPIQVGIQKAKENMAMQQAHSIALAMFEYANDNNGAYPDGKTSTEVFQKLIDEKYVSDSGIFYVDMPGKTKAQPGDKLTAENVCFDVTAGVTSDTSDQIPIVFLTGYSVTYTPGADAVRDSLTTTPFPGIDVAYKSNTARFLKADPDGTIPQFVPQDFDPGTKTYRQLKP